MCAEALTSPLNQAEHIGSIAGVPIGRSLITINHFFFVDDSFLFYKTNSLEWSRVLCILEQYERAFEQMLNKEKTSIFFSRNTPPDVKITIVQIAGVRSTRTYKKYLGLPATVERSKCSVFNSLLDKTRARISNWKQNFCLLQVRKFC